MKHQILAVTLIPALWITASVVQGGMITLTTSAAGSHEYSAITAWNYTGNNTPPTIIDGDVLSTPFLDNMPHGVTVEADGSTGTVQHLYEVLDANTWSFKTIWDFDRAGGAPYGNAVDTSSSMWFVVEEEGVSYSLDAEFRNSGGNVIAVNTLFDRSTPDGRVFEHVRMASAADHIVFNSTGSLIQGHIYDFSRYVGISGLDEATGRGYARLIITRTAAVAVPEPGSSALCGIAALGIAMRRMRRNRK
jgi:hypothetical protein